MPAQHRRTYGAIYEIMLAGSFTLLPLAGFMLADNPNGFRLIALPATLGLFVAPVLVYLLIPESPRWYLRKGNPEAAVEAVNRIISRCGRRIEPLTVAALGEKLALAREALPSFTASPSACSPPDRDTAGAPSPRSRAKIQRRHEPD